MQFTVIIEQGEEAYSDIENPTLVKKIRKALEDKRKRRLHSWEEFEKAVEGK